MNRVLEEAKDIGGPTDVKKLKIEKKEKEDHKDEAGDENGGIMKLSDDLLIEVFKLVDGKSLCILKCVDKKWNKMISQNEQLEEMIVNGHWLSCFFFGEPSTPYSDDSAYDSVDEDDIYEWDDSVGKNGRVVKEENPIDSASEEDIGNRYESAYEELKEILRKIG